LADALVYAALAIVATWPLVLRIATHAAGAERWNGREIFFETPTNIWNLWWFRFAIVDLHQSPFNGTYTFYPVGADLWLHTLSPLPAAAGAILQTFVGVVVTYNLLTLAALVTAGVAAAALGRRLGLTPGSARAAGAIYAFAPAVFARIYAGHFELLWIAWLPLTLLLFLRTIDPAERGSVMTLLYPKYTVVVPEPGIVKIPLAYPVARRDHDWASFLNTWIELKRRDGTIDALYGHWIMGNGVTPDIVVPFTQADATAKKDPQMARAIQPLS
jgi:hypothetical protein